MVLQSVSAFIARPPVQVAFKPRQFAVCSKPLPFHRVQTSRRARATPSTIRMVKTESTMLPLGTSAPSFDLLEPLTGKNVSLEAVRGEKGTLVVFMCNHCPFVILLRDQLKSLGADFKQMGISMVGISSNDVSSFPQDGVGPMAAMARSQFSTFPYLYDETQDIAKAYRAACTPDVYLFDADLKLVYRYVFEIVTIVPCHVVAAVLTDFHSFVSSRGRVDEATPGNGKPVTGACLRAAADKLVSGQPIPEDSMYPSIGCNIKWKEDNWPNY